MVTADRQWPVVWWWWLVICDHVSHVNAKEKHVTHTYKHTSEHEKNNSENDVLVLVLALVSLIEHHGNITHGQTYTTQDDGTKDDTRTRTQHTAQPRHQAGAHRLLFISKWNKWKVIRLLRLTR